MYLYTLLEIGFFLFIFVFQQNHDQNISKKVADFCIQMKNYHISGRFFFYENMLHKLLIIMLLFQLLVHAHCTSFVSIILWLWKIHALFVTPLALEFCLVRTHKWWRRKTVIMNLPFTKKNPLESHKYSKWQLNALKMKKKIIWNKMNAFLRENKFFVIFTSFIKNARSYHILHKRFKWMLILICWYFKLF